VCLRRIFDNSNASGIPNLNVHILIANNTKDRLSETYCLGNEYITEDAGSHLKILT
jgi:hypothetical protein